MTYFIPSAPGSPLGLHERSIHVNRVDLNEKRGRLIYLINKLRSYKEMHFLERRAEEMAQALKELAAVLHNLSSVLSTHLSSSR